MLIAAVRASVRVDAEALARAAANEPPPEVWPTLREILPFLASPDPRLRDELAFGLLSDWVYERDLLVPSELRSLLAFARSEDGIRRGLGEEGTDNVFARSFAVLVIALALAVDNRTPYLTDEEFSQVLAATLEYAASERDLRGFVPGKGWAHAAAHVADALGECVSSRYAAATESRLVLDALCSLPSRSAEVFGAEEDERIAIPLAAAVELGKLSLPEAARALEPGDDRVERINRKHIARSLYFRLERPDELLPVATTPALYG